MHDTVALEESGVRGVFVATEEFRDGAAHQAAALGAEEAAVFIAHPVQDRTDDEMRALADGAVDAVVAALADD